MEHLLDHNHTNQNHVCDEHYLVSTTLCHLINIANPLAFSVTSIVKTKGTSTVCTSALLVTSGLAALPQPAIVIWHENSLGFMLTASSYRHTTASQHPRSHGLRHSDRSQHRPRINNHANQFQQHHCLPNFGYNS
jgi:hypothetical protein